MVNRGLACDLRAGGWRRASGCCQFGFGFVAYRHDSKQLGHLLNLRGVNRHRGLALCHLVINLLLDELVARLGGVQKVVVVCV